MQPRPSEAQLGALKSRLGPLHLNLRLGIEHDHAVEMFGHGRWFHPENWLSGQRVAAFLVRASGLGAIGRRLARRHRIRTVRHELPRLDPKAPALRLLHLSDLHLDMAPDTATALAESLARIEPQEMPDLAVITGDFRARTYGPIDDLRKGIQRVRPHLPERTIAVLGNHDCLAVACLLEDAGIRVLLNEAVPWRDGVWIAGVDDPHYYRVHNLDRALAGVPEGAVRVLLSHSPEIYRLAAHAEIDLMLAGHTHGGQVCLPGGWALTYDCPCPRRFCRGAWRYRGMAGYTSAGCGTSILDIRFFCPPEIVIHELRGGAARLSTGAGEGPGDTAVET